MTNTSSYYNTRRQVKDIAIESDTLHRSNSGFRGMSKSHESLDQVDRRINAQHERLNALRARGVSRDRPDQSAMSRVRSGIVLAGGAATRVVALAAATGVGVAEGAATAIITPVKWCAIGTAAGGVGGANLPVGIARPFTAAGGAVAGAAAGAVVGALSTTTAVPQSVIHSRSFTQRTFRAFDQFPKASAHVKRKNLSTSEIADRAERRMVETLNDVDRTRQAKSWNERLSQVESPWYG